MCNPIYDFSVCSTLMVKKLRGCGKAGEGLVSAMDSTKFSIEFACTKPHVGEKALAARLVGSRGRGWKVPPPD
jgi:hypothetical protein